MTLRKIARRLHLVLGLLSGIIVFIVCITGAVWAFNKEITACLEPEQTIAEAGSLAQMLSPSRAARILGEQTDGKRAGYITYTLQEPVRIGAWGEGYSLMLLLHPESGKVIKTIDYVNDKSGFDFFGFVLRGHRFLWLPWQIGRPIVHYACIIFIITLVSGVILWMPKRNWRIRLWFTWKKQTGFGRKLLDLHSIAGFYAFAVLLIIALTGVVFGLDWYSKGRYTMAKSDVTHFNQLTTLEAADGVFKNLLVLHPGVASCHLSFPAESDSASVVSGTVYPRIDRSYDYDSYTFDRYTLQEIPGKGRYKDAGTGDTFRRMNRDIHTGAVLGLPGRIIAFLAALIGASLPVTGVYLWWRKRKYHA